MILNIFLIQLSSLFITIQDKVFVIISNSIESSIDITSKPIQLNPNIIGPICDTTKIPDSTNIIEKKYIVAGSFLIPKNAENQIVHLRKLGFQKCFTFNFPESEFYSVVVDTFNFNMNMLPAEIIQITDKLKKYKVDYFFKKLDSN